MAWEARLGLKLEVGHSIPEYLNRLNGLGSPFGIETFLLYRLHDRPYRLNGLGSPFGIETKIPMLVARSQLRLNGLGSPFGIETV